MLPIINIGEVSQVTRIVTRVYSSCLLLNQFQSKITITCFVNLSILVGTRVLPRFITLKTCYDLYLVMIITCYKFNRLFPGFWSRQQHMDFPPGLASPARSHWEEVRFSPEVFPPAKKIGCEEVAERPATMITWGLPIPGYMCYLNLWWNCLYISLCIYVYILVGGNIWVRQWEGWHPIYEMEKKMKPPTRFSKRLNKKMKLSDDLLLVLVALVILNNGFQTWGGWLKRSVNQINIK